jgi:FkbH-like protein
MPENVRLVVWDLDETFWGGTLSEGSIDYRSANHELVIELARRGIVSSICSKNNIDPVRTLLQDKGLWDYFIFPSVNWEPKGARIAAIVEAVQLRAPTVLFIDDNPAHLQEACAHAPGLQIAGPEAIAGLLDDPRCKGKDDRALTRLAQYKLLERRHTDMLAAQGMAGADSDNTAFLRESDIRVTIEHEVTEHIDRAVELINRTNQMNFTKRRLPEDPHAAREMLLERLRPMGVQAGLLKVSDRYGDYGYVGFFLVSGGGRARRLEHFCFSCRILGMGVERWLYQRMERPRLEVQGEVVVDVFAEHPSPDWIRLADPDAASDAVEAIPRIPSVRVRSGCNGLALTHYFKLASADVLGEFNTVEAGDQIRLDHSCLLRLALEGADPARLAALAPLGITEAHLRSRYFDPAPAGSVWVYSNWVDGSMVVYRHKTLGILVPIGAGAGQHDLTQVPDEVVRAKMRQFGAGPAEIESFSAAVRHLKAEFVCEGVLSEADLKANLALIFSRVPADGRMFVLLAANGAKPSGRTPGRSWQERLNRCIREAAADFRTVTLVDVAASVHHPSEMPKPNHFQRMVYYRIYREILAAVAPARPAPPHGDRMPALAAMASA